MKKRTAQKKKKDVGEPPKFERYLTIIISVFSLVVSLFALVESYEAKPLAYYAIPTITSTSGNSIFWDLEFIVTNGAVGDVRVLNYQDGQVREIANNVGGTIRKGSSKAGRTFQFRLDYDASEQEEFYAAVFVLVHGKDGSQNIGMVLFDINAAVGEILVQYYSPEDLLFAEMDPGQDIYAGALSSYRELLEVLKAESR